MHMKILGTILMMILAAPFTFAGDIKSGEDLVTAMHKKYDGKWYKTLTFKQITTNYKPGGSSEVSTWYEALNAPGMLRIDFEPLDKHEGVLFAGGKLFSYRNGKL